MSNEQREKVIAGEVVMLANELQSLNADSVARVYYAVGRKRWMGLRQVLAAAPTKPAIRT